MTLHITLDEIRSAALLIGAEAVRTPVVSSSSLDELAGCQIFAKAESQQRVGSFKFRGAFHRLSLLTDDERTSGVVAVSSGNHGAAVSCAAHILGIPATVHIPEDAPASKRRLIEQYGATVVTFARSTLDREGPARAQAAETGAIFVHPYEDPLVMMGQGTAALELHEQVGQLDALLVPMSGGGLMAGCASAMQALDPDCELIGVEPETADDTRQSFRAGHRVTIEQPVTIADGLAVCAPGENTFSINRLLVSDVVAVSELQIANAAKTIHELLNVIVEPSGAVAIAAILADPERWAGKRVGVILSGGNT